MSFKILPLDKCSPTILPPANTWVYIESKYNDFVNKHIVECYSDITDKLKEHRHEFLYFPVQKELIKKKIISTSYAYTDQEITAWQQDKIDQLTTVSLCELFIDGYTLRRGLDIQTPCFAMYENKNGKQYFKYYPLSESGSFLLTVRRFLEAVREEYPIPQEQPRFSFSDDDKTKKDYEIKEDIHYCREDEDKHYSKAPQPKFSFDFEEESRNIARFNALFPEASMLQKAQRAMTSVQRNLKSLRTMGLTEDLIEYLVRPKIELGAIHISQKRTISIPQFKVTIFLRPLPMALYLLFLKHPEGIAFKSMPDYRDELRQIYTKITNRVNAWAMSKSIDNLADPLSNALNENCSLITREFRNKLPDAVAGMYTISGDRGEVRSIKLLQHPNMVVWD